MNPFSGALQYFALFREHVGNRLYIVLLLTIAAGLTDVLGLAMLLPLLRVLDVGGGVVTGLGAIPVEIVERLGLHDSPAGILLLIGGLFLLKALIHFANSAYQAMLGAQLLSELKGRLFDAYSRMSYLYYVRGNTGHFVNVISSQASHFYTCFLTFTSFASKVITVVVYFGVAMALAWQFGLAAIIVGTLLLVLFRRLNEWVRVLSREGAREGSQMNKILVQTLQAYKYLASTDQLGRVRPSVLSRIQRLSDIYLRARIASGFTGAIKEPLSILFIISIITFQIAVLEQSLAPLLVAILLVYRAMNSILGLQSTWQSLLSGIGSVEMVRDELEALSRHRERGGQTRLEPLSGGIEFRGVHFAYDAVHGDALADLTLTIPARSTVAFVGESGAGKSTLVDLLTLLLKPQHGEIRIDGVESREVEMSSWRSQIGYVSQDTVVFDDTIAGNIAMLEPGALPDAEMFERIAEAAQRANIHAFIERLPEGYRTVVGERGVRLSGGQRQRLFIARELFKRPSLLILDEATSALDTEAERAVQESIDGLHGEMTVVMIAHRLSTIRNADRVYVLERGRVVEEGPFVELRERADSRFRRMINLQAV